MIWPCADKGLMTLGKSWVDRDELRRRFLVVVVVVGGITMVLEASASAMVD